MCHETRGAFYIAFYSRHTRARGRRITRNGSACRNIDRLAGENISDLKGSIHNEPPLVSIFIHSDEKGTRCQYPASFGNVDTQRAPLTSFRYDRYRDSISREYKSPSLRQGVSCPFPTGEEETAGRERVTRGRVSSCRVAVAASRRRVPGDV